MAVTLANILDALADQIRTEIGAAVSSMPIQVEPRMVLSPTDVTVDMYPADPAQDSDFAAFGESLGGLLVWVRARVGTAADDEAQDVLLDMMDDEADISVAAAIESDRSLGGIANTLAIREQSGYRDFPIPGSDPPASYLGCLWSLVIVKARS